MPLYQKCIGENYICADMEQAFYDDIYARLVVDAEISRPVRKIPEGVEITTRENGLAEYLFVQNFNSRKAEIEIPQPEYQVLYGNYDGSIHKYDTVVFK